MDLFSQFEEAPIFTVSEITSKLKSLIEKRFSLVTVTGEISNCRPASSGHLYFSLKDNNAVLSAAMFRGQLSRLSFVPKDGQKVTITGNISLYEPRGSYQIICHSMLHAGEGDLLAKLEERKRRLAEEGLFDASRKQIIPKFPKKVAIITSPTGAALQDVLNVMKRRRSGSIGLQIFPAVVQGADSAKSIVHRIEQVNLWNCADVIILGRGGGSIEDLLSFSEEEVVRAVAASKIPIISAVGHEIDFPLCDFASDLRAPTPSAAAEMVTTESEALYEKLYDKRKELKIAIRTRLSTARQRYNAINTSEMKHHLQNRINTLRLKLDHSTDSLKHQILQNIQTKRNRLNIISQALQENSPESYRQKGLVRVKSNGKQIAFARELQPHQQIQIEWTDATVEATVNEVKP